MERSKCESGRKDKPIVIVNVESEEVGDSDRGFDRRQRRGPIYTGIYI